MIFKCKCEIQKPFNLPLESSCTNIVAVTTTAFRQLVGSSQLWNGREFKGILLLFTVVGPGVTFILPKGNNHSCVTEQRKVGKLAAQKTFLLFHLISKKFIGKNGFLMML